MARPLNLSNYPVTIAAGASLSPTISIGADAIAGILFPPGWTAGPATFQVTIDGVNYFEFYDLNGNEITVDSRSTAAAAYAGVDSTLWRGVNMFRVRSGTLALPVVQTSAATLIIVGRGEEW